MPTRDNSWNAARACDVLGINRASWELYNMEKALGFFEWRNTREEEERRQACIWVRLNRRAYNAECARRRDARSRKAIRYV